MNKTIKIFNWVLSFAGISIFAREKWDTKVWFTIQLFNVMICSVFMAASTGYMINNSSDLVLSIQGACIWTATILNLSSLWTCLIYRSRFRNFIEEYVFKDSVLDIPLIQQVMRMEPKCEILMLLKELVSDSYSRLSELTKVGLVSYLTCSLTAVTQFVSEPIYLMMASEDKSLRLLAFEVWFPRLEDFRVFVGVSVFNAYTGYLFCFVIPGFMSMLALLLGQIIRQLKILTFILINLNEIVKELVGEGSARWQEECTMVMKTCFQHYIKIKRFSRELSVTCQLYYLSVVLDVTLLVCVVFVKIKISALSLDLIKYYIQGLVFIFVNLLFCFLGQRIENECEQLEEAVSEKWYIYDRQHKFHVQMFMVAASQKMPIYIFGSVTLSLFTFTWFIKTSMSFFTLMMSFLED